MLTKLKKVSIHVKTQDKFFAEFVYDTEHNVISDVRSFNYRHSLDKYAPKFRQSKTLSSKQPISHTPFNYIYNSSLNKGFQIFEN